MIPSRYLPLALALMFCVALAVLTLTPLAMRLAGRAPEGEPELFYVFYGVPAAMALVTAGVVRAQFEKPPGLPLIWAGAGLALAGFLLTQAMRLFPGWLPNEGSFLTWAAILTGLALTLAGAWTALRR